MSRLGTVGGSVFIAWMVFPQLSFLFRGRFRIVLICSLFGAVAAAIFCIIPELGVFVVQGWTGDMAAGVERPGPTEIMTAWRRLGELTQMLVSGGGSSARGRRPARCRRMRWRRGSDGRSLMAAREFAAIGNRPSRSR